MLKNPRKHYILFFGFSVLYIGITLLASPDPLSLKRFNVSDAELKLLSLTVAIPLIAIWALAFYGFIRFKQYTRLISKSADGSALNILANGHMLLAYSLPITTLTGSVMRQISRASPDLTAATIIFKNYVTIALTLAAFSLIAAGARQLRGTTKQRTPLAYKNLLIGMYVIIAMVYIYLTLHNPIRQYSFDPAVRATFYLPDWLLLPTIILPYLHIWYLGIRAATDIQEYHKNVSGRIYKPFLRALAIGISWVITSSITLQILTGFSVSLSHLKLKPLLLVVYGLLILIGIGYVIVARATRRLKMIEEV